MNQNQFARRRRESGDGKNTENNNNNAADMDDDPLKWLLVNTVYQHIVYTPTAISSTNGRNRNEDDGNKDINWSREQCCTDESKVGRTESERGRQSDGKERRSAGREEEAN